ncbi:MAG: hypothetical protein LQ352_007342, partial [Teloschistes flavicans]
MAGYSNYGGPNSAHTIDYSCIDPLLRPAVNQSQNVQVQPRLLTDSPAVNQSQNARVQPRLRPAVNRSQNARVQPRLRPAVNRSQNAEVQHTLLTSNSGSARIGPFGIPINDIHRMIRDPYDATWASTWGIDHATLAAKGHKKTYETFEALYTNGVIKTDDELYRVCSHTVNGVTTQVEKVAKITGS